MPWYLYLALKQLFPTGRRFPFFTAISVLSVALGVGLLIVVLSVMGGFSYELHRKMMDVTGDVQVRAGDFIRDPAALQAVIAKVPGVLATTPFAEGYVMLDFERRPAFPTIQGVDVNRVRRVIPIDRYVIAGSFDALDDDSIILSSQLAVSLGARIGSRIEVYTPLMIEKFKNDEFQLPTELTVSGVFEVGHQQLDSSTVIVTLRRMQDLYGLGQSVHGINVRIAPDADADAETARINQALELAQADGRLQPAAGLQARSWREINQDFLWVLQLEKNMMLFILLFVVLVAAFLTMSLLLVLVLKKTREIGLLSALGASRRLIALCFCLQGVGIGVVGTLAGLALGFVFGHFRNDLVRLLTSFTGSQQLMERFYQFSQLPWHTDPRDLAVVVLSALALSTLAGIIPAILAARMNPVEALRHE